MDTRQVLTGVFVALAVFLIAQTVISWTTPEPPPAATQPAAPAIAPGAAPAQPGVSPVPAVATPATTPATTPAPRQALYFTAAPSRAPLTIGGSDEDVLELTLTPRGAGVESIRLTARNEKGRYVNRAEAEGNEPYEVVSPVVTADNTYVSFATHEIKIQEYDQSWNLSDLVWTTAESSASEVVFTAELRPADGGDALLRLRKGYRLEPGKPFVELGMTIENSADQPFDNAASIQDGPPRRDSSVKSPMYDMRKLMVARNQARAVTSRRRICRSGSLRS